MHSIKTFTLLKMFYTLLALLVLVYPAQCRDLYLDAFNGRDSNDGLAAGTAFETIGKVIEESEENDVINIAPGGYSSKSLCCTFCF